MPFLEVQPIQKTGNAQPGFLVVTSDPDPTNDDALESRDEQKHALCFRLRPELARRTIDELTRALP